MPSTTATPAQGRTGDRGPRRENAPPVRDGARVLHTEAPTGTDSDRHAQCNASGGAVQLSSIGLAALAHAAAGRPVFPCKPDKTPRTPKGFKDATTDPKTVRGWWIRWPDALIGMPTGAVSGCLVLDVDVDQATGKDGEASLSALVREHGPLPDTVESLTPRGGRHLFFRHPGGTVPCSASKLGPDLDIRGDGGYVVLPPSRLPDGRSYQWEGSSDPDEGATMADAPAWLLALVAPQRPLAPAAASGATAGAPIPEGGRNAALTSLGGTMRRRGMGEGAILAALLEENNARCSPPLPEADVRRIAKSVSRYPPAKDAEKAPESPEKAPGGAGAGEGERRGEMPPKGKPVASSLSVEESEALVSYLWRSGRHAPKWSGWPRVPVCVGVLAPWPSIAADGSQDGFMARVETYLPRREATVDRKNAERIRQGKPPTLDAPPEVLREHAQAWQDRITALPPDDARGRELLDRLPKSAGIGLTAAGVLLGQPEPLRWLVKGLLPPNALGMLFGAPASGKSLIALHWAACVATGAAWHGRRVTSGPVVYLAGEGQFGIRRRLKALAIHHGNETDLRACPLVVSARGAALTDAAALEAVMDEIDGFAEESGTPALIVIDTLHRNFGAGDENSAADMGAFVAAVDGLRERYQGASVLIVHHSGHAENGRARGSSALRASMDFEYCLEADAASGVRTLSATKHKDMPPPGNLGFDLEVVELPWLAEDGEAETSVVLVPGTETGAPRARATPALRLAFDALLHAMDAHGLEPPEHWKHPEEKPVRVVGLEGWRSAFYARHTGEPDAKKKAFQRARADLKEGGAVGNWVDTYWPRAGGGTWPELGDMLLAHAVVRGYREATNEAA